MAHIANAFTSDGAVKLLWDLRMADEAPRPKTSREDIGIHQGPGGTRLNSLASSSGATRGKTFTPPFLKHRTAVRSGLDRSSRLYRPADHVRWLQSHGHGDKSFLSGFRRAWASSAIGEPHEIICPCGGVRRRSDCLSNLVDPAVKRGTWERHLPCRLGTGTGGLQLSEFLELCRILG